MLNVDVFYLVKNNRSTNIVYSNKEINIKQTINNILNHECLKTLSTLDGRINAIKQQYNIYKFIPIYLNENLILQPIYPKKHWRQIYINICNVKKIEEIKNGTKILFNKNIILVVETPYPRIKQYLEKCLKIKKNQFNKYERGKFYYGKEKY